VIVALGMMVGLIYNLLGLTQTYLSYPVAVNLNVLAAGELVFPAVTVCNLSPVKQSAWLISQHSESQSSVSQSNGAELKKLRKKRSYGVFYFLDNFLSKVFIQVLDCSFVGL